MSKLRKRIESLSSSTTSLKAVELCKEALSKMSEYTANFGLTPHMLERIESTVGEVLVEGLTLATDKDAVVENFITTEKRILAINNLGVKEAIAAVKECDLAANPSLRYIVESITRLETLPEYITASTVVEKLQYFKFEPTVAESVNTIVANIKKYGEDIKIYTAVKELNETKSSFLYSSFQDVLENYLNERTAVNRAKVLESLGKFSYDPMVRNLHNVISEATTAFHVSSSDTCIVENVFSPVLVTETTETFNIHGKYFTKTGSNVTPLTESEVAELPAEFTTISNYLNQDNVTVSENAITVWGKDKKVVISENEGTPALTINNKSVSLDNFNKIYMNSSVFNRSEIVEMSNIHTIVENWDIIMELDFVKSLRYKTNTAQRVDVFQIDETIHLNKVNPVMNENSFIANCTATQSRELVLEYMNYDLGTVFRNILPAEEQKIASLTEKKSEYLTAIKNLEEKQNLLENHPNPAVKESAEVKEIIVAIAEEITNLKNEYYDVQNEINSITKIAEGIGFAAGDEASVAKKK
jgi:hypothetical protein